MDDALSTHSLGFLITDTARLLRKRFDHRARQLGLTRAQWQVLAQLARNEGINQAGLADLLEIEPITLSRHLDNMEAAGWVERRPDPNDRRVRLLFVSQNAGPVLEQMRGIGRRLLAEATDGLPAERTEQLTEALTHIRAALASRCDPGEAADLQQDRKPARVAR